MPNSDYLSVLNNFGDVSAQIRDFTYPANSFVSNSRWSKMERIFSAVHLSTVTSKSERKTAGGSLRICTVDRVSSSLDVSLDTAEKAMDYFSRAISSKEAGGEMHYDRTIVGGARSKTSESERAKKAKNDGGHVIGQLGVRAK